MDSPHGKPAESVKRFTLMKWAVAGAILLLLALTWLGGPDKPDEPADGVPGAGADAAGSTNAGPAGASATTMLTLELAADGGLKVGGVVADEATRNQWLNEIRIGAQGRRVTDDLRVGSVSPAAADWTSQLSGLVAVMRERQIAGLRVEGDRVILQGAAPDQAAKRETDNMVQAQLPSGYRLESKVAIGPSPAGAARASAESSKPSASTSAKGQGPSAAGPATAAGAGAGASAPASAGTSSAASSGGASPSSPAPAQKGGEVAPSAAGDRSDARALAQNEPAGEKSAIESKTPVRKPANCPRQLRPLAQPVYFKTDAAAIAADDRSRLKRLGECLGRARVRIVGHADPRHTDEYNQELSERRAKAVAEILTEAGANPSRVTVVGAGKVQARAKKPSRQALQRARRVDIQLR